MSRSTSAGRPARSAPSRKTTGARGRARPSGCPRCASSATRVPCEVVPGAERHPPDRAGARAQRFRRRRVGAAVGERDRRTERVGGADQRADVARVGEPPERERRIALLPARQVVAAVDGDHPRRMPGGRHLGEELRLDVLPGPQQIDRLGRRRLDGVLPLDEEEAELLAPAPLVQLAHELQALVVPARDHRPDATGLTDICRYRNILRHGPLFDDR